MGGLKGTARGVMQAREHSHSGAAPPEDLVSGGIEGQSPGRPARLLGRNARHKGWERRRVEANLQDGSEAAAASPCCLHLLHEAPRVGELVPLRLGPRSELSGHVGPAGSAAAPDDAPYRHVMMVLVVLVVRMLAVLVVRRWLLTRLLR